MLSWLRRRLVGATEQAAEENVPVSATGEGLRPEEVYHDAARHFLDVQISTLDVLDNKTSQTFSVGSTVLTVTFALLNLSARDVPVRALWALGFALFFYGLLLVFSFLASLIRALEYRPDIATVKEHSEKIPGSFLRQWVSNEYLESIETNKGVLIRKARWVGATQISLHLEAASLATAALLTLIGT